MDINLKDKNILKLYEDILNQVDSYIFVKDIESKYIYANTHFLNLFHLTLDQLKDKDDFDFFEEATASRVIENDLYVMKSGETFNEANRVSTLLSGKKQCFNILKKPIFDENEEIMGIFGIMTNVTELYELKDKLEQQATVDTLTGAHNRRYFFDRASGEISRCKRLGADLSLVLLDIDNFKGLNDQYGHAIGDYVLQVVSDYFREVLRTEDLFARLTGEEFAMLFPNLNEEGAYKISERIRKDISELIITGEWIDDIKVTISFGVSSIDVDKGFDSLYFSTEKALKYAKEHGKNQVVKYSTIKHL